MYHLDCQITSKKNVCSGIWVISIFSPEVSFHAKPGQFINVKVTDEGFPLLRRPFSIHNVELDRIQILFNVVGSGTRLLSQKNVGNRIDILGPLGNPFTVDGDYETALLIAGGMGVAPIPFLTSAIKNVNNSFITYVGAKTASQLLVQNLEKLKLATDDGSEGYHGTVVDFLRSEIVSKSFIKPKIFACGPPAMLNKIAILANEFQIPCEVSIESMMACGFGICQGCPVEIVGGDKKYALVCKDGPVFDVKKLRIPLNGTH